jgi:hypothetical protein
MIAAFILTALTIVLMLLPATAPLFAQARRTPDAPAKPAPRWPDGTVKLSAPSERASGSRMAGRF